MHTAALAPTAPATAAATAPLPVPWPALVNERRYLVQFARRRLLDPALAEDLVHDVFEAVASGRALFAGRSALRSWLVGILKHKIVDLVRERSGHDSLDVDGDDDEGPASHAHHLACPQPLPDEVAEQRERLAGTLARIDELPATLRQAVELRLLEDRETADVCERLAITEQNLFVRLHRARKVLAG
jgi:RNA polymerase sigma-70 factor (ECF subfamily)